MNRGRPTYEELKKRLAAAEPIVQALKNHEVDAVVGRGKIAILLLRGVEEALVESERVFRGMFGLGGIGLVVADAPSFHFTKVNPKLCEILGYTAEELLAKSFIGLTHPQDRKRAMKEFSRVVRGKADSWSIEKRGVRKDGSEVWMGVHGAVLRDASGRVVRIVAMVSDLSARKRAEQELVRFRKPSVKRVRRVP